jgi:ABC-type Zn2+ transport system substrate-binding protein/surface adhesin
MPIDHENLRLDHTHCRAICDDIGERLRETMGQESTNMTPNLRRLIDRLDELDNVSSPGTLPLIEDPQDSTISEVLEPA